MWKDVKELPTTLKAGVKCDRFLVVFEGSDCADWCYYSYEPCGVSEIGWNDSCGNSRNSNVKLWMRIPEIPK